MKITKIFYPLLLLMYGSGLVYAQSNSTVNNTAKCIQISRTSMNWQGLIAFPTNFAVPANTTKYLHMMVLYPAQPDIAIRVDGADENSDGDPAGEIRPLNVYTDFGEWGTLVFPIEAGNSDMQVNAILIFPDAGFENEPAGQVLDDSGAFGYIDEIIVKDNALLSIENVSEFNQSKLVVYPNPSKNTFKIISKSKITKVSLYDSLGKEVVKKVQNLNGNEYSIRGFLPGLYFIHVFDDEGGVAVKKLFKE